MQPESYLDNLIKRYSILAPVKDDMWEAYIAIKECYRQGKKLLVAGNGGSACSAQHIVAELMKGFKKPRELSDKKKSRLLKADPVYGTMLAGKLQQALPAIALNAHSGLNTAFANDVAGILSYAQQVNGYGREGDVLLAISTSGDSENIICAAIAAQAADMKIIGFTGETGGKLKDFSDICVKVPCSGADLVQELQLPIYHCWCLMLEEAFF